MKKDAHYYALLALCRLCGFRKESAQIIAYASQYIDDAKVNLMFIKNPSPQIQMDRVDGRPAFFNVATCHSYFWIKTFNYEAMVNNTSAFHFVPGCEGENFTKKMRCKADSPVIRHVLDDIIKENDLIKLGMALHSYADSFAHQGFSGLLSKVNDIKHCEPADELYLNFTDSMVHMAKQLSQGKFEDWFDRVMPAYGHGQALDYPDLPYLVWSYEYDYSDEFNGSYKRVEIDNRVRYTEAFMKIKAYLEEFLKRHPQYLSHESVGSFDQQKFIAHLISPATDRERIENWLDYMLDQGLYTGKEIPLIKYKQDQWLKEAFVNYDEKIFTNRMVDGVELGENFIDSKLYHFFLATKWYKKKFFYYCAQYGLTIPK